ncbi:hypothetical protein DFH07DRAFT_846430 [Mycena maculata]|uniref:Uncharacterized protein n=1 Tax=Mycena maculata TaxID=230809 RepID=A0AAD7MTQ6_9AGAR|nr:hypothetical protein DFH07DRAFT_846430 [Mycena maculata]
MPWMRPGCPQSLECKKTTPSARAPSHCNPINPGARKYITPSPHAPLRVSTTSVQSRHTSPTTMPPSERGWIYPRQAEYAARRTPPTTGPRPAPEHLAWAPSTTRNGVDPPEVKRESAGCLTTFETNRIMRAARHAKHASYRGSSSTTAAKALASTSTACQQTDSPSSPRVARPRPHVDKRATFISSLPVPSSVRILLRLEVGCGRVCRRVGG